MYEIYPVMLLASGALLLLVGGLLPGQSAGSRALNLVLGVGFVAYGTYLKWFFTGDSYLVLYYAFLAPIFLIFRAVASRRAAASD
ncbi:hypothetical protein GCM10010123_24320 [Pilimelia anulata]|uniref:Uncharacterized protein n=1 Tax=Pilimelia anulata TaxID=53371 RepID=A0A8J3B6R7_9ACTN|nr:hypothetical protein [Pilimelia anulata]GGJ93593.1 hypothetical protein GCM10010123_24320 [Pilimelia anulata]